jgi:uncharacterized protein YbjT (DUF2867 family)
VCRFWIDALKRGRIATTLARRDRRLARGCHDVGIAQFCLLSAAGSTARSRFRYVRVMGMKEDTVRNVGFAHLAIFRPGIIVGNAHTPAWVGWQY